MPEFTLTAPPPSVNAMYFNRKPSVHKPAGKVRGRGKTDRYQAWIRGEMNALLAQRARPVDWPVTIEITLPAKLRGDCDNRIKGCQDLLVRAGIIPSDSARFVHSVSISRGEGAETIVRVETISTKRESARKGEG